MNALVGGFERWRIRIVEDRESVRLWKVGRGVDIVVAFAKLSTD